MLVLEKRLSIRSLGKLVLSSKYQEKSIFGGKDKRRSGRSLLGRGGIGQELGSG